MDAQSTSKSVPQRSRADREHDLNIIAARSDLVRKLRFANDAISKDMFVLENRIANSLQLMGFSDLNDLEETIHQNPSIWGKDAILANAETVKRPASVSTKISPAGEVGALISRDEFEDLKRQVDALRMPLGASRKANVDLESPSAIEVGKLPTVSSSPSSEIKQLKKELQAAERRNEALSKSKEALEAKYKADYNKWYSFKKWMVGQSEQAKHLREKLNEDQVELSFASSPFPSSLGSRGVPIPSNPVPGPSLPKHGLKKDEGSLSDSECILSRSPTRAVKSKKSMQTSPGRDHSSLSTRQKDIKDNGASVNALYTIDASRNGGVGHQYDEVVRGKARAHLDAGDCDCCKEYYSRLDPAPDRLQPPQWASQALKDTDNHRCKSAERHKKDISRHRHRWTPPETPPDYWNIGFPTTQEVADINQKATELHAKKRRRIEEEANTEGGRYVRRR